MRVHKRDAGVAAGGHQNVHSWQQVTNGAFCGLVPGVAVPSSGFSGAAQRGILRMRVGLFHTLTEEITVYYIFG